MKKIEFNRELKQAMVDKLKRYFQDELDQELGGFDAEFLIDFFGDELGAYYYNKGLEDAQNILQKKVAEIDDAFYEIERPIS